MLEAAKKNKVMHSPHPSLSNHTFAGRHAGKKRCDRIPIIQIQSDTKIVIVILNNQIIIRYISHQDIKSFHGETIQMRSSPFSA